MWNRPRPTVLRYTTSSPMQSNLEQRSRTCGGGQRNSSAEDGWNAPGTQLRSWGAHVPPMKAKKAVMAKMAT